MIAFARALEVIPRQLCDNAGFDATDVLNKLRQKHALKDGSGKHFGVDVNTGACVGVNRFACWVLHNHAGFVKGSVFTLG
jgi:T-complex protein 1 subunit eta